MSNQLVLINIFNIKDNIKYKPLIKDNILNEETKEILKFIEIYYEDTSVSEISDWVSFGDWFLIKHPMFKPEKVQVYKELFNGLSNLNTVQSPEAKKILGEFITRNAMAKVADAAMRVAEGENDDVEAVYRATESLAKELGQVDNIDQYMVEDNLDSLLAATVGASGYNWRLPELNLALGPLPPKGCFINLLARPDVGKTTMLASEATYIAAQLPDDEHVIWFNNEEDGRKVKLRCVQAALARTVADIEVDPRAAWEEYGRLMRRVDKIKFYDRAGFSVREVEEVLNKYKPGLIIFDQLRKVKGFERDGGNDVGRVELIFNQAREWAKAYASIINVHQAGGEAEGKQYFDMTACYGSQTVIQGESDVIMGIGMTPEPGYEYNRYLGILKNKMMKVDEQYRRGKFELRINPTIARYESGI